MVFDGWKTESQQVPRKLLTVGLIRFSLLTTDYYARRFRSLRETAAHLFSPDRMELRFRLFEKLCLPSLLRQSDSDFKLIVLTSDEMPPAYLERLLELTEHLPHIQCRAVGPEKHYKLLQSAYNSVPSEGYSHRALFRLDDDDAVDVDFIARGKRLAEGLLKLQTGRAPFIIANNRGIYVQDGPHGREVFDACEQAPLSAGATLVAPVGHRENPYRYNHRRFARHYNTYSDISVPGFIRTIHGDNKSKPAQMGLTRQLNPDEIDQQLQTYFQLRLSDLYEL